jgi:hypothetical protein
MSTRCQIEFYDADPTDAAEPAARIYKHSDGYPDGVLPLLKTLEKVLAKGNNMYGARLSDPEWAAAEFVSQFRKKMGGNIYVTQTIHGDIEYLYRVVCTGKKLEVKIFRPVKGSGVFEIAGFEEVKAA